MTRETFSNSKTRHGTPSGYRLHQILGERPCDACVRAKQEYDRRRLQASDLQLKNRMRARAQNRAKTRLVHLYPDEYLALYREALSVLEAEQ